MILAAIGDHCLDQEDLRNEDIQILSLLGLFTENFHEEEFSLINYLVIMKYSLHRQGKCLVLSFYLSVFKTIVGSSKSNQWDFFLLVFIV